MIDKCIVCGKDVDSYPDCWTFCARCTRLIAWADRDTDALSRLGIGKGLCFDFTNLDSNDSEDLPVSAKVYA